MNDHSVMREIYGDLCCVSSEQGSGRHRSMAESATAFAKPNLEKRDAILAAALRLIARFGLHNTPMSAVAREAGVAVGTVYLYFPSKEAMINALYLHVLEDRTRSLYSGAPAAPGTRYDQRESLWQTW